MPNYDELKKKAKDAIGTFADASVDAYKVAEEKTKVLARKTKLRAGIVNDKATIRRLSVELGTKYYNQFKDDENSDFRQLCEEITSAHERIAAKEGEIAELRAAAAANKANKKCCDDETKDDAECCDDEKSEE